MLTSEQIRQNFLDFWSRDPRNSKVIQNASLVPQNVQGGNTLLFVNSGMFPIIPYLVGQPHPLGTRVHNVQRCIRTKDIEDVGDNRHLVEFEMIGNWSFGDFTKAQQIPWCLELYVKEFGLDPKRLYITVWGGDEVVPRDDESIELWKKAFKDICNMDIEFSADITNIPKDLEAGESHTARIYPYGREANWWEVAHAKGEPGGPSSEIFYDLGVKERDQEKYHINDDSGRFVEI
jgi:alanyl-tRNA synthetase